MAEPLRGAGRFVARYDRLTFYEIVRLVAHLADPVSPERVTMRRWNEARALCPEFSDIPLAWEICRQLAETTASRFPGLSCWTTLATRRAGTSGSTTPGEASSATSSWATSASCSRST